MAGIIWIFHDKSTKSASKDSHINKKELLHFSETALLININQIFIVMPGTYIQSNYQLQHLAR